jgi:hypothetical protein
MVERIEAAEAIDALDAASVAAVTVARTRQAYLGLTLLFAALVAWGFWATYFAPLLGGTSDRPRLIHVHAAVFVGWVLLLVGQAAVVVAGRVRLHQQIGVAGMCYGAVVLAVGLYVSIAAPALRVRSGFYPLEVGGVIVLYNLIDMLLYGVFLAAAFVSRNRPDLHKRWIISATAALGGAAIGRVLPGGSLEYLAVWLAPVLALIVLDVAARRRLSAVPLISGALIIVAFFKVPLLAATVWRDVGRALLGPFV